MIKKQREKGWGGVSPVFISQAKLLFEHALSQEDQTVCLENYSFFEKQFLKTIPLFLKSEGILWLT